MVGPLFLSNFMSEKKSTFTLNVDMMLAVLKVSQLKKWLQRAALPLGIWFAVFHNIR